MRRRLANWLRGQHKKRFYALKNVSFELEEGGGLSGDRAERRRKEHPALAGGGAGHARHGHRYRERPDRGAAGVGLGVPSGPDGTENVRVNASLIGLSRRRTAELFDPIVEFAGIGDFIGEPLRTYSTGMIMRLAFSVAINMDPEILLIDEVLAVGDQAFQAKCFERLHRFRHAGKTLLCVSHAAGMVQQLCDRAIWLDRGELMMSGRIREVIAAYEEHRTTATA